MMTAGQLADKLDAAAMRGANMTRVLDAAAPMFEHRVMAHFDMESSAGSSAPAGNVWADWSARYAKRKKPGKKLDITGRLKASVGTAVHGNVLSIGSRLIYSRVHDSGYSSGNIPMRKYLSFHRDDVNRLFEMAFRYVIKGELSRG